MTAVLLVLAVWFLAGTALAEEAAPLKRGPEAAKKLFDLPEASEEEYAEVEGTWELSQDTAEARKRRRVKTHQAGKTTVTGYDADGNIVGQHNSEYKLKATTSLMWAFSTNLRPPNLRNGMLRCISAISKLMAW